MNNDWLYACIRDNSPFVLYANCSVDYQGRASSHLAYGNYLILYKHDGSIQIHGADKILPRNYQGAKSQLSFDNNVLMSTNRSETININIKQILHMQPINNWSDQHIVITKTEKELVNKLYDNWANFIGRGCSKLVKEYATDHGPVDIVGCDEDGHKHVVEVKRRKASIKDVTQLRRYLECIPTATGYIAAPDISQNALKYAADHHCKYIHITFD